MPLNIDFQQVLLHLLNFVILAGGLYLLLKETIDNSIDEFAMGFGKQIQVNIEENNVSVRDFGRGIPLDSVIKATSILNTGGKVFASDAMTTKCYTSNCYIGNSDSPTDWVSSNDKSVSSIPGGSFDSTTGAYIWSGPSEFTKAMESDVKNSLSSLTTNNGNGYVGGAFGPKFAEWVEKKDGFAKDMLGTTRTQDGTWPGAVEILK